MKITALAISSGLPNLLNGYVPARFFSLSGGSQPVFTAPGDITLTVIPYGPNSTVAARVKLSAAHLLA